MPTVIFLKIALFLFLTGLLIAYYFDYRKNKENYKEKGQGKLYLVVIVALIIVFLKLAFF